jgi:hypothetical protein
MTRLDEKLARIRAGNYKPTDFIIADAKDGDMGSGLAATGFKRAPDGSLKPKTRSEFLDGIQKIVEQDVIDVMLVSASNLELLHERGVFKNSAVKPVIRANDTTDCWGGIRHGTYRAQPSHPFRTANLARVMYGETTGKPGAPITGTDLGLYSVTFLNEVNADRFALEQFALFRQEAAAVGFKYFFEVFNPNVPAGLTEETVGPFINDCILRCLAGVMKADRPQFLKMVYNGPKALEELCTFDPTLIVGVLGGGAGTTRDTFELVSQAERHGARVALFGRKINLAESPLELLTLMRQVASRTISAEEAVRAYHGELQKLGIKPTRSLDDDRVVTEAPLKQAAMLKAA